MFYHRAFLGVVISWLLRTVTITVSHVWALSTLRKLSWMCLFSLWGHGHLGVAQKTLLCQTWWSPSISAAIRCPAQQQGRRPIRWSQRWFEDYGERHGAGNRQYAQPIQAPTKLGGKCKRPWDGRPKDGSASWWLASRHLLSWGLERPAPGLSAN